MKDVPIILVGNTGDCPDIEYATGFKTVSAVVLIRAGKKNYMVVPGLEYTNALAKCRNTEVYTPESLGVPRHEKEKFGTAALMLLAKLRIRKAMVQPSFYHGIACLLQKKGIRLIITRKAIFPERAVKNAVEQKKIGEAQQAAVIAMRTAVEMIARSEPGAGRLLRFRGKHLTSELVKDVIRNVLIEHNCICRDLIVSCGTQTAIPHERGTGPLRVGEPVIMDIFPQNLDTGYWGDLTRTVVRGKASPVLERMYHAVKAAQNAALNVIRPGVSARSVHEAAVKEFERNGFRNQVLKGFPAGFIHGTGHGVGLAIHESPGIGFGSGRLKTGNVITVEPGLYYPDIGGVRIEDTVVVTPSGWRYLVPCEKRFEL
jgi:Xaa-Pro aminopeptidase